MTFEQACQEPHFRCEAIRADNLLDSRFRSTGKALISTEIKHLDKEKLPCLAKDCEGLIVAFLPLCKGCFLQCKSGKVASLELRDGLGTAKYNSTTSKIEFPSGVPKARLPGYRKLRETRKGLMFCVVDGTQTSPPSPPQVQVLLSPMATELALSSVGDGPDGTSVRCLVAASPS